MGGIKMEFDWRWSLIVCVIVCFFGFLVGYGIHESFKMEAIEKSCEIDGMGFHYGDEFDYCIDSNGNAIFVIFNCEGLFWNVKCDYKIINIGDIRVIKSLRD